MVILEILISVDQNCESCKVETEYFQLPFDSLWKLYPA